jgi:hypothetical protein
MGDYTEKATLDIYYDNPNEASDMYLKWLIRIAKQMKLM